MSTTSAEIISQLQDFRARVLQADKLRRTGDLEAAQSLMPSREELIQAVKAYRAALGTRAPAKAASASSKSKAATIAQMDDLSKLF